MADKRHNFTRTEVMAGLMVAASVLVLAGFIAMVNSWEPPKETNDYTAKFTVTRGLNIGADVRFGGVKAGRVTGIAPDPADQSKIVVAFNLDPAMPVNTGSRASVESVSLTSDPHLEITTGLPDAPRLESGAELQGNSQGYGLIELPDLNGVIARVEATLDSARKFLDESLTKLAEDVREMLGVQEALKDGEMVRVADLFAQVDGTLGEIQGLANDLRETVDEQRPNLTAVVARVKDIEDSTLSMVTELDTLLKENGPVISNTLKGVEGIVGKVTGVVDGVAKDLNTVASALELTLSNTTALTGTANEFLQDNRPAIEDIIDSLRDTVRNLQDFSRTLADQPQSVLRGKVPEGRKN